MKTTDLTLAEKLLAYSFGIGVVAVVVLAFNVIPWLLWNKGIAPMFGWRHFTFWQVFLICWAISWVGRLVFGARTTK